MILVVVSDYWNIVVEWVGARTKVLAREMPLRGCKKKGGQLSSSILGCNAS
jgi:hypothetical protein